MKKIVTLMFLLIFLCSCAKTAPAPEVPTEPVISVVPAADPFYTELTSSDARPIAVMIDNDDNSARPHAGLENAYLVYEITVEGSATRFMALFKNREVAKLGPVRSARHYFLDYALENDAIFAHAGQSPKAGKDISALGIADINGLNNVDGAYFHRDYTYTSAWHTLYTGTDKLNSLADAKGFRNTTDTLLYSYNEQDTDLSGEDASSIVLPYAPFYRLTYEYNTDTKMYERYINGSPHSSQSGQHLFAKNVIILYVDNYDLNDGEGKGRQELDNIGAGKGYFVSDGKYKEITWSKTARKSKTIIKDESGLEISLNPGITYIQIIPEYKGATIK